MVLPTREEARYHTRLQKIEEIVNNTENPAEAIVRILQLDWNIVNRLKCSHVAEGRKPYKEHLEKIIITYAKNQGIEVPEVKPTYGL